MHMRRATAGDAERIAEIYNWYILNTIITFETNVVSPREMTKRIQEKIIKHDWLVGEVHQEVIGYAYYGPFRPRAAYHHTMESTIYLAQKSMGQGFGRALYVQFVRVSTEPRIPRSRGSDRAAQSAEHRLTSGNGIYRSGSAREGWVQV